MTYEAYAKKIQSPCLVLRFMSASNPMAAAHSAYVALTPNQRRFRTAGAAPPSSVLSRGVHLQRKSCTLTRGGADRTIRSRLTMAARRSGRGVLLGERCGEDVAELG
ncbi:hypothetical protein MKEN_01488600 [Mycena kentingensis (nom. inval.)]|nr:hypothetical protein MKEN_01488600 [Mycena kentingensis (nom. inval.)]